MYLSNIFGGITTICVLSALFPTSYALKHKMLIFTSKDLPHQTASFLGGVPYSHLQSCLSYLISDPFFDMLLIENS